VVRRGETITTHCGRDHHGVEQRRRNGLADDGDAVALIPHLFYTFGFGKSAQCVIARIVVQSRAEYRQLFASLRAIRDLGSSELALARDQSRNRRKKKRGPG